jgi:O-antigen/teichoic acid export membrane protein
MPLGTAILAAGKQRAWSLVQFLCVVVSVVLDPLLVPWFQHRTGNGGLGLCVASVVSEAVMIGFGIALVPKGIFDRKLTRLLFLTALAGAGMVVAAQIFNPLGPVIAALLSIACYALGLWLTGAVDKGQVTALVSAVVGRSPQFAPAPSNS